MPQKPCDVRECPLVHEDKLDEALETAEDDEVVL